MIGYTYGYTCPHLGITHERLKEKNPRVYEGFGGGSDGRRSRDLTIFSRKKWYNFTYKGTDFRHFPMFTGG